MKSRAPIRAAVLFLALGIAGASLAEEGPDYAQPGYYVVLQGGVALWRDNVFVDNLTEGRGTVERRPDPDLTPAREGIFSYTQDVGTEASFGLRLGHRWKHWAFEADGEYVTGPVDSFNLTANGRWYPWTHRLQPYLLGGLGFTYVSPRQLGLDAKNKFGGSVVSMRAGAGFEFYITEHIFTDVLASYYYVTGPANLAPTIDLDGRVAGNDQSFFGVRLGVGYRFF